MEALSFHYYLENQRLISYDESKSRVKELCGDGPTVPLTPEDYVLGIFDLIGELMRFSITSMATNGRLPTGRESKRQKPEKDAPEGQEGDKMDVDEPAPAAADAEDQGSRSILDDLRELRLQLEMFEPSPGTRFCDDVESKSKVMRECVDKVEKALYSLTVRGKERPKGWRPDAQEERRPQVESY
jgi:hypothetical protein